MIRYKHYKLYCLTGALIGWFAVGLQLYVTITTRVLPLVDALIKFFSYFTILTNILIAACFTALCLKENSKLNKWFSKNTVLTPLTVDILVVGLVYNLVLRSTSHPVGLGILADELLHSFLPAWVLLCWFLFVDKNGLEWRSAFSWLIYPLVYLVYILIRGAFSEQYPYFFLNVIKFGYMSVIGNCVALFFIFLLLFWLFIWISKKISARQAA